MADEKRYLLMCIGCLECGVDSAIAGIFTDKEEAETIATRLAKKHRWRQKGENSFEVFELPDALGLVGEFREE